MLPSVPGAQNWRRDGLGLGAHGYIMLSSVFSHWFYCVLQLSPTGSKRKGGILGVGGKQGRFESSFHEGID